MAHHRQCWTDAHTDFSVPTVEPSSRRAVDRLGDEGSLELSSEWPFNWFLADADP